MAFSIRARGKGVRRASLILSRLPDDLLPNLAELVKTPAADHPAGGAQSAMGEAGPAAGPVLERDRVRLRVEADLVGAGNRSRPIAGDVDGAIVARLLHHLLDLEQRAGGRVLLSAVVNLVGPGLVGRLLGEQLGRRLGEAVENLHSHREV